MIAESPMEPIPGRCNAVRRDGQLCRNGAGKGTAHKGTGRCELHAGNTPSANRSAARQIVEAGARAIVDRLGRSGPSDVGNVERLLVLARECDEWLDATRELVRDLQGDFTAETLMQGEMIRAAVVLYTDAIERVQKLRSDLVRLNLEERAQRLDEAQSRLVWAAVDRGLRAGLAGMPELYGPVREAIGRAARSLLDEVLDDKPGLPAGQGEA